MASVIIYSVCAIIAITSAVSGQEGGTCRACNCQFNNVEVLDQLIESKIASAAISGVTYTRWGRTSCPNDTEAQLVYSGRAGGTNYLVQGGSAEIICLPDDPDYTAGSVDISSQTYKHIIQGVEYEFPYDDLSHPLQHVHNQNAPCAVCDVPTRSRVIMVPAKTVCPPSWTREYYGYLMTEHDGHYRSTYTCIDSNPEVVPGEGDENPSLVYYSITDCNGLLCPPYENGRILSCVVCTK